MALAQERAACAVELAALLLHEARRIQTHAEKRLQAQLAALLQDPLGKTLIAELTDPCLWSPGIKWGVRPGSFTYENELFGPVLGVMRAENLEEAIRLANGTRYGLTSGIYTLDDREKKEWIAHIEAGNCYVNRGITGAIVRRQPFGGCKESSFGKGAKAGGPNYVMQLMNASQAKLPVERAPFPLPLPIPANLSPAQLDEWNAALGSYAYHWKHYFSKDHDPSRVLGQDNILRYVPHPLVVIRVQEGDDPLDILKSRAAASLCGTPLEVSSIAEEDEATFIRRLKRDRVKRVRLFRPPSKALLQALADNACTIHLGPALANGRLELLHYLREVCISSDTHRYGNISQFS